MRTIQRSNKTTSQEERKNLLENLKKSKIDTSELILNSSLKDDILGVFLTRLGFYQIEKARKGKRFFDIRIQSYLTRAEEFYGQNKPLDEKDRSYDRMMGAASPSFYLEYRLIAILQSLFRSVNKKVVSNLCTYKLHHINYEEYGHSSLYVWRDRPSKAFTCEDYSWERECLIGVLEEKDPTSTVDAVEAEQNLMEDVLFDF
jgi:hypothetical protein